MAAASLALVALLLQAAPGGGRVRVQVTSATSGVPVRGASVELPDLERRGVTGENGVAVLQDVPAGPHHLRVRRVGYAAHHVHVFVGEGRELHLTVVLTPLPTRLAEQRVESPPLVDLPGPEAGSSPLQRVVTDRQLRQHPLVPEPDVLHGLAGGHVAVRSEAPGGLSLLGGPADHVAFRIDGIPVRGPYHGGATFAAVSPDAIAASVVETAPGVLPIDDALGGSVRWATRPPAKGWGWMGGASATQARLLFEGGNGRAGVMAGGRLLFPGLAFQKREPAHLVGEASDGIVRMVVPLARGILRGVGHATASGNSFASRVPDDSAAATAPRHDFSWRTASAGLRWTRTLGATSLGVAGWHTRVGATGEWYPDDGGVAWLNTHLLDRGTEGTVEHVRGEDTWSLAGQLRRLSSDYEAFGPAGAPSTPLAPASRRWVSLLQGQWRHTGPVMDAAVGSIVSGSTAVRMAPFVNLAWHRAPAWRVSVGAARRFQHTQSLRNGESIGGLVFVADAPVVADGVVVPVARSDQVLVAASWTPSATRHVTWRGWARRFHDLALPAIGNPYPFSVGVPARGRGHAVGTSLDAAYATARWGVLLHYALQDVSVTGADTTWRPEYAVAQVVDAGAITHLTPQLSLRLNASGGAGRRATGFTGAFEWESCNLRDRGCEFAGAPGRTPDGLGAVALPSWVRWDLAARAHGHVQLAGREAQVDVYASWSNVFNRRNVLTRVRNRATGALQDVVMRPRAPLVVGLEWKW